MKIARWSDINYWALKQTTEKTHRTLHKFIRQFQVGGSLILYFTGMLQLRRKMINSLRKNHGHLFLLSHFNLICMNPKLKYIVDNY